MLQCLDGDYMILVCRNEISTRQTRTDFTLRLLVLIKFRLGKTGKFSFWSLFRFVCIFFEFFFVSMSVNENPEAAVCGCSSIKVFLKISQYSQETPMLKSLFNKVAGHQVCNFIKKRLSNRGVFGEYCEILTAFFIEDLRCPKPIDFHWFKFFLLELFSLRQCLFFFHKMMKFYKDIC